MGSVFIAHATLRLKIAQKLFIVWSSDEPTTPPPPRGPVVWVIERFGLSLYKLVVFIKGFYAVTPPPVVLWSGFGCLITVRGLD